MSQILLKSAETKVLGLKRELHRKCRYTWIYQGFEWRGRGSDNPYVHLEARDFNYGWGGIGKVETWFDFAGFGRLDLRARYSQLFSVDLRIHENNESHDFLSHFLARYDLPVAAGLGLRLEYSTYGRHMNFEYHPSLRLKWSQLGASLVWMF